MNMKDEYFSTLDDYAKKTQNTATEYSKFKSTNEQLLITTKKLKIRIKDLLVSWYYGVYCNLNIFNVLLIIQLFIRIK